TAALAGARGADAVRGVSADQSNAFFVGLRVTPSLPQDAPEPQPAQRLVLPAPPPAPSQTEEPPRLIKAAALMKPPVDEDFLRRVDEAWAAPLPAEAGEGEGGGLVAPAELEPASAATPDGGSASPSAASSDINAPAASGGGGGSATSA